MNDLCKACAAGKTGWRARSTAWDMAVGIGDGVVSNMDDSIRSYYVDAPSSQSDDPCAYVCSDVSKKMCEDLDPPEDCQLCQECHDSVRDHGHGSDDYGDEGDDEDGGDGDEEEAGEGDEEEEL